MARCRMARSDELADSPEVLRFRCIIKRIAMKRVRSRRDTSSQWNVCERANKLTPNLKPLGVVLRT